MVDVLNLLEYWREWPPCHEILKIVHGVEPSAKKKEEKKPVDANDPSGIGGLLAQFPGGAMYL
jgi:hypothetical protein